MGRMGQALAGRLLEQGHDVTIWNRSPGRAPELVGAGAKEAVDVAGATSGAEVVMTSLANDEAVRQIALGTQGVLGSLGAGDVYADTSTVSVGLAEELGKASESYVAMPVLGPPSAVRSGQATYLVGGSDQAAGVLGPLFPGLSPRHIRYPAPARASAAKLTVNLLLLDGLAALAEAFAAGRAGGLGDDDMRVLLTDSPMLAPGLRNRFEGVLTGDQGAWWTAALGAKDARLAVELAATAGSDLPVTSTVQASYERAAAAYLDADIAAIGRLYRR
jgi:3-hydroxyisobutyrate dehydrogenase-like beta-hydroxyacid dehydrogenase